MDSDGVGIPRHSLANQSRVLSLDPDRPAQFNSAYMLVYFIGGTIGTAIGGGLNYSWGWPSAAATAAVVISFAAIISRTYKASP